MLEIQCGHGSQSQFLRRPARILDDRTESQHGNEFLELARYKARVLQHHLDTPRCLFSDQQQLPGQKFRRQLGTKLEIDIASSTASESSHLLPALSLSSFFERIAAPVILCASPTKRLNRTSDI